MFIQDFKFQNLLFKCILISYLFECISISMQEVQPVAQKNSRLLSSSSLPDYEEEPPTVEAHISYVDSLLADQSHLTR